MWQQKWIHFLRRPHKFLWTSRVSEWLTNRVAIPHLFATGRDLAVFLRSAPQTRAEFSVSLQTQNSACVDSIVHVERGSSPWPDPAGGVPEMGGHNVVEGILERLRRESRSWSTRRLGICPPMFSPPLVAQSCYSISGSFVKTSTETIARETDIPTSEPSIWVH